MIIEPGTILFHGTGEDFPEQELRPGGDNILWTAESPDIAQNYIPISGSSMIIAPQHINRPDDNRSVQAIQCYLGIEYDYNRVTRDQYDRINGWLMPKGWDHTPTEKDVKDLLDTKGFPRYGNHSYEIHTEFSNSVDEFGYKQIIILPPGGKIIGRLFIIQVKEPLNIFDMTHGGELDGDLMEPDYNKFSLFTKYYEEGFDGVKINDFAQSKKWGNIGHYSIGLFNHGLLKCQWTSIPASNFDWDDDLKSTITPEYAAWQKLRDNPLPINYRPPYMDINIEPLDLIDDALIDIEKAVSYLSKKLPLYATTKLMNAAHRIRRCGETSDDWHTILFVIYARLSFLIELIETQSLKEVSRLIQEIVALLYSIITNEPYLQKLNSQTKVERIFDFLRKT